MKRVEGKVAVVTGAASGIGLACARRLAENGATLVLADVNRDQGEQSANELRVMGVRCLFVEHDVSSEDGWQKLMDAVLDEFERLDVLVNNAGISGNFPPNFESIELSEWHRVFRINVDGVFLGVKHAILTMKRSGNAGSIINIGSVAGFVGTRGGAAYGTSKGAIRSLTKHAAVSCARQGLSIRVNAIHPSYVWTPFMQNASVVQKADPEQARQAVAALHPFGKLGEPDDIAWNVVYLASDEAKLVTGADFVIDGGFLAQ
jgi:NAD(P)-dependent dehydrogenase (short-subunit alcohol dehydrogenase family)